VHFDAAAALASISGEAVRQILDAVFAYGSPFSESALIPIFAANHKVSCHVLWNIPKTNL
jgi:hypothetical protein